MNMREEWMGEPTETPKHVGDCPDCGEPLAFDTSSDEVVVSWCERCKVERVEQVNV
jgi:hypothetical protein